MTYTETCTCGASIAVTHTYAPYVVAQSDAFRQAHRLCRERPPVPPLREPRVRMYRISRPYLTRP